ncbi:MAG: nicotinate mononucleotide-dependent phosphoribosyltransferase CobT [Cyanobacteria bacterium P01_F01_bin.150]
MIRAYSPQDGPLPPFTGEKWIKRFQGKRPIFACILGFTETALIPGISAAGATPDARCTTALADAEFLYAGPQPHPKYPLPPLTVGVSPAFISRAVIQGQDIPLHLFNAGLPESPSVPHIELEGQPAQCVSTGQALSPNMVKHLFSMGLQWGDRLAQDATNRYVILGECVVGGTTTALGVLTGLGWAAMGKVNSSHPTCNHRQKQTIVTTGLGHLGLDSSDCLPGRKRVLYHPEKIVASVGDPMQPVVAGMAIAASRTCGVLLAGGTQMLAVYALIWAWSKADSLFWQPQNVVIATTRWVADDPTGDTLSLARELQAPLLVTQFNVQKSRYPQLQKYEEGFVKEGVGAGGCAIASTMYKNWTHSHLIDAIEHLLYEYHPASGLPLVNPLG